MVWWSKKPAITAHPHAPTFPPLPAQNSVVTVTPPYEALRVAVGVDLFLLCATNGFLLWVLLPENAAEGFRELDVSGGGVNALDEAYAYTAVEGLMANDNSAPTQAPSYAFAP
jgi:hypothetical protein